MHNHNFSGDIAAETMKGAPPAAVAVSALAGLPLEQWVFILTMIYLLLQIGWMAWKYADKLVNRKGADGE